MNRYAQEAKNRWGDTEAYKQSQARVAKMTKSDLDLIQQENDRILRDITGNIAAGPKSAVVQSLIARHYDGLRKFYDPTPEMYRGLAEMYVSDSRFAAYYEKYAPGLAGFMRDAMTFYADSLKQTE